jgi:hypothetical protein
MIFLFFSVIGLGDSSRCSPYPVFHPGQRYAVSRLIYPPSVLTAIPHTLLQARMFLFRGAQVPLMIRTPISLRLLGGSCTIVPHGRSVQVTRRLETAQSEYFAAFHRAITPGPDEDLPFEVFVR